MDLAREISYGLCLLQMWHRDMHFLYVDEKFAEITQYDAKEIVSDSFSLKKLIAKNDRIRVIRTIVSQLQERGMACAEVELLRKDFKIIHTICFMSRFQVPESGEDCVRAVILDITENKVNHELLQARLERDSMTKLYNKETIEKLVGHIIEQKPEGEHAFYMIDLDNFKDVNDSFGHVFGDTVIQDMALSVRKSFPERAKIGRIGGDEFVVFLPDTDREEAQLAARHVAKQLIWELPTEAKLIRVSCSIGITMWKPGMDYQELLKQADAAMYYAKDSGKNQSAFFRESMLEMFRKKKQEVDKKNRGRNLEDTYDVEFVFFAYQLLTDSKQFDSSLNLLLDRIVERYKLDRVSVYDLKQNMGFLERTNMSVSEEALRLGESRDYLERDWMEQHLNGQGDFVVNRVRPGENIPTFSNYIAMPKSYVACGLMQKNEDLIGSVVFSKYLEEREWTTFEVRTFHELSMAIAGFVSIRNDKQGNLDQIHHLSTRDKVTGLLDQKNFESQLKYYIEHCREYGCIALVFVDIKNFSYINERYGMEAGDEVLSNFGKLLSDNKGALLVGRFYADCFLEVYASSSKEQAVRDITGKHEPISQLLQEKYPIASLWLKCGIYFLEDVNCQPREAIENANMARKSIKANGRRNYCVYTPALRENWSREQAIITEFLRVREQDALELCLQPSFRIGTKEMANVEVFGRWYNEEGVKRKPEEIIPVLKKNGYMLEWDLALYERALRLLQRWKQQGVVIPLLGINFFARDFFDANIVQILVNLAEKYDVDMGKVVIEVSEKDFINSPKEISDVLQELHERGFQIGVDNFGNDYFSVEMLVNENIDVIKIGRNLMEDVREVSLRDAYLRYIRNVADSVNKDIILVGVENDRQEQEIRDCGYELIQGYLYERELPVEEFEARYIRGKIR